MVPVLTCRLQRLLKFVFRKFVFHFCIPSKQYSTALALLTVFYRPYTVLIKSQIRSSSKILKSFCVVQFALFRFNQGHYMWVVVFENNVAPSELNTWGSMEVYIWENHTVFPFGVLDSYFRYCHIFVIILRFKSVFTVPLLLATIA